MKKLSKTQKLSKEEIEYTHSFMSTEAILYLNNHIINLSIEKSIKRNKKKIDKAKRRIIMKEL